MTSIRTVEFFDSYTKVLEHEDTAKKVYGRFRQEYTIEVYLSSFVNDYGYKVVTTAYGKSGKKEKSD